MRRNPSIASRARWGVMAAALMMIVSLSVLTAGAQAVVVNDNGVNAGVALLPASGERAKLPAGMVATNSGSCFDPALTSDLTYQPGTNPLCYHDGTVLTAKATETFALTWDADRRYWSGTRAFVEQYLKNVADASASGSLNDPYALAAQYVDNGGNRAGSSSTYGGGCIDYGNPNNSGSPNTTCLFGSAVQTGPGNNYPASTCTPTVTGDICLTDGQLQGEISSIVSQMGILTHAGGRQPMLVLLLPSGVETCLDSSDTLCSANTASGSVTAQFCSYHSQVNVGGREVSYVVQPWTVGTLCDEPDVPSLASNPTPDQLSQDAGARLVSPISQAEMGAITDPALNGWTANDWSEINDNNGCVPVGNGLDKVTIGSGSYYIQREWNNAAAIAFDPWTYFGCAPGVNLIPTFVVPSAVEPGDTVVFDGSTTASTLIVPNVSYQWDFGDKTGALGPSVTHSFDKGGSYNVTLTVIDRGGNKQSVTQTITVLGANGLPVPPSNPPTAGPTNIGSQGSLMARMLLLPQALRSVLRSGISVRVSSNEPANGFAQVLISRATAKRLHIKLGHAAAVVIGRGTLSQVRNGTVLLHLHLSHATVLKLKHVKHTTLTVRLALVGVAGDHLVIDAAGRY